MRNPVTGEDLGRSDKNLKPEKPHKKVVPPLPAHHLWISHKTPRHKMQFLTVVVPRRAGEAAAVIRSPDNAAASVTFRGKTTTVSFDPSVPADLVVDAVAIGQ
jgi:hypothetical protein